MISELWVKVYCPMMMRYRIFKSIDVCWYKIVRVYFKRYPQLYLKADLKYDVGVAYISTNLQVTLYRK